MLNALMPTYSPVDLNLSHGDGLWLVDQKGRRYLDFTSGIGVLSLGHCHPHLVGILKKQAEKLWHTSNLFHIPSQQRLAERLVDHSFADRAFICNSGTEANEMAIKMARLYGGEKQETPEVIVMEKAFHGRTTGAMAAGDDSKTKGFGPLMPGFKHVPFNNLNALRAAITHQTSAIMLEPVQGEGGIQPASPEFMTGLQKIRDEFQTLLIFDEVQCGMGRTGKLFAYEHYGVTPDILMTAKGLGGGFPIGAVLATEKLGNIMVKGTHGSTFGGNPLATSVANGVLDVMVDDENFLTRVQVVSQAFLSGLREIQKSHKNVLGEPRGLGLMLGIPVKEPHENVKVIAKAREKGLLLVGASGNVIRFLPPLTVTEDDINYALNILHESLS